MNTPDYAALISLVMPMIVAAVVKARYSRRVKAAIAVAMSIVGGAIAVYAGGGDPRELAIFVPATIVASQVAYHAFWKPTGLAPWFEQATDALLATREKPKP